MAALIRPYVNEPGDMKRLDSCIKDFVFDSGWREVALTAGHCMNDLFSKYNNFQKNILTKANLPTQIKYLNLSIKLIKRQLAFGIFVDV